MDESSPVKIEAQEIGDLTRAFQLFSKEMGKLERSYSALKKEFRQVNLQLEMSNKELEQKVAELDTTTAYLRGILDSMAQGILFIEATGEVTTYNRAAEAILAVPSEQVLGRPYRDSFADEQFGLSIRDCLKEQKGHDWFPSPYTCPDGRQRHLELSIAPANLGLILLLRDRTEIRQLQSLAARNDRLKELGEMAAAVAHEIRNPLGGIKGFAALLARDLEENPHQAQMASSIVEGAAILDRLVSNVLHYARPISIQLKRVSFGKLIEDVIELVRADQTLVGEVQLLFEKPTPALFAKLDPELFKGALLNLYVNAIHATSGKGEVRTLLTSDSDGIHLSISDDGCGIQEENLEKIFSPFFTTKEKGNGLGLAEVHKVIQAHNGTIELLSHPGQGTTFTIHLGANEWPSKRS